ncbi:MAG TPA: hypothetical protein VNM40_01055 [Candidatus Paceibacterota bacterium]|nr:hypothetical protein [Candidatus Paceibacterota bacterium]
MPKKTDPEGLWERYSLPEEVVETMIEKLIDSARHDVVVNAIVHLGFEPELKQIHKAMDKRERWRFEMELTEVILRRAMYEARRKKMRPPPPKPTKH